jgi:hypothetical protein
VPTDPGSVREEAERLVTTVLAAASVAARDLGDPHSGGSSMATGDRECCVCPLCRLIAAVRDPDPDFAERLATGAGDLAAAAANMLRAFTSAPPRASEDEEPESTEDSLDPWRDATRAAAPPPPRPRRKPMAKKAVKPPVQKKDDPETDQA